MVDIHDPTATSTLHDPNYTLQSHINITGLFYIGHTQLLIGVISNITLVMNIHGQLPHPHPQSVIHDYTFQSNISITKLSRTYPYTNGY